MADSGPTAPEVREAYLDYVPPFDVASLVRDLLSYVPAEYVSGLKEVVLLNASGLARRNRRQKIRARGKRFAAGEGLGFYRRERPGAPAHIGLHVDRIVQHAPGLALRVSVFRESIFASILYHEVGHHIHRARHREHADPEKVADRWAARLKASLFQRKYPAFTPEAWQRITRVGRRLEQRRRQAVAHELARPTTVLDAASGGV